MNASLLTAEFSPSTGTLLPYGIKIILSGCNPLKTRNRDKTVRGLMAEPVFMSHRTRLLPDPLFTRTGITVGIPYDMAVDIFHDFVHSACVDDLLDLRMERRDALLAHYSQPESHRNTDWRAKCALLCYPL